jgi:N-acyl-D-aspartate/D-glutamate deacylase
MFSGARRMLQVGRDRHRSLEGRRLGDLAQEQGKHVVDVMLDLAVAEGLETELQVTTRPPEEEVKLAALVQSGYAIPSQTDAGAHVHTNVCPAGESSYVLSQWVRERQFLSLEDAVRRLTFQPARRECRLGRRQIEACVGGQQDIEWHGEHTSFGYPTYA